MHKNVSRLVSFKSRGEHKGIPMYPHKHKDGTYVASTSRFKEDYVYVNSEKELEALVRTGMGARMSNRDLENPASFIASKKIKYAEQDKPEVSPKSLLPELIDEADLDIDSKSKSRKEQAFLRAFLANGKLNQACVLCRKEFPIEFLIAAHIKKRSDCSRDEKLDFENVAALMCKAGCDDLYEKGYVYVSDGVVCKNTSRVTTPALDFLIGDLVGNTVRNWKGSEAYYKHHEAKFNK